MPAWKAAISLSIFAIKMSRYAFWLRVKWIFIVLFIMLLDILPLPVMGLICLYLLLARPRWFKILINEIYDN